MTLPQRFSARLLIRATRWWLLAELRAAAEPVRPARLPDALATLLDGSLR
ncbi:MAG TPA: hypothetical protein VK358_11025 [Longimicrobium sp.]|nr:hypothetical protein [Longimicrobium sp.]